LEKVFEENQILSITFIRWTTKNYCQLETITNSPDALVEDFCVDLKALRQHDYIAKQQAAHLKATKKNVQEGEYVVICNFSENYAFIV
jgi:DNA-binding transcriptional MerR regulator